MPIIHTEQYPGPPWYQRNGHTQTLFAAFGGPKVSFRRERLELPDDDFVDLDWLQSKSISDSLVILTHGLEGNSQRPYMRSAANYFHQRGWDALSWNCRSCSGEMNRQFRLYHHGEIEDLGSVVTHALQQFNYQKVALIGFSMGGAMTTKYLSVHGDNAPAAILGGISFSAPFDLKASVDALEIPGNRLYKTRFLGQLSEKVKIKNNLFPGRFDVSKLNDIRTWYDFDEWFSAPWLGLSTAAEFYAIATCKNYLDGLRRPILAVSAINDPIITEACLPLDEAKDHPYLTLELTPEGGHVGYKLRGRKTYNWMDVRAWEWVQEVMRQG